MYFGSKYFTFIVHKNSIQKPLFRSSFSQRLPAHNGAFLAYKTFKIQIFSVPRQRFASVFVAQLEGPLFTRTSLLNPEYKPTNKPIGRILNTTVCW